eukprot:3357489-Rhodomonas_salina.2
MAMRGDAEELEDGIGHRRAKVGQGLALVGVVTSNTKSCSHLRAGIAILRRRNRDQAQDRGRDIGIMVRSMTSCPEIRINKRACESESGRKRILGRVLSAICELQDEVVRHTHVAA